MRKFVMVGVAGLVALGLAATAFGAASGSSSIYKFKAALTGAQEVPKPKAPAGAGGAFTAKTVEAKAGGGTFTWKLTFHGLSGAAVAAHVHLGKKGVAGGVAVSLCGPCKSGMTGKTKITAAIETALETGKAYVNVHTAKNPGGEIRGQIKNS